MTTNAQFREHAQNLLDFIDASPSPWHATQSLSDKLAAAGYTQLDEAERWALAPGGRYYVLRGGASLIAFSLGKATLPETGFRLVGAHTDSPGLRLKPNAAHNADGIRRLGVEVYGSPILATFTDRDLSLAGRVSIRQGNSPDNSHSTRLLRFDKPLLRLPNLAIHMNRDVNEQGLKLNKQTELPLLLSLASNDPTCDLHRRIAHQLLRQRLRALACRAQRVRGAEDARAETTWRSFAALKLSGRRTTSTAAPWMRATSVDRNGSGARLCWLAKRAVTGCMASA